MIEALPEYSIGFNFLLIDPSLQNLIAYLIVYFSKNVLNLARTGPLTVLMIWKSIVLTYVTIFEYLIASSSHGWIESSCWS